MIAPLLHPELGLPYGVRIVIAEQPSSGALWSNNFPDDQIKLMERMALSGRAWIFQKRKSWTKNSEDYRVFQRIVVLKTP